MKKKIYFQKSIVLYCGLFLFLSIACLCFYAIIYIIQNGLNSFLDGVYFVAAIGGFIFMVYTFIRFARNRIVLKSDEIFVPAYWGNNKQKLQFETHIEYSKIYNIRMITGTSNSLNKESKQLFTPMPYIIFDCDDNKQMAINVFYYSKKQVIQIIDEIIKRAKTLNNNRLTKDGNQIISDYIKLNTKRFK